MKRVFILGAVVASLIPQAGASLHDATIDGTRVCVLGYTNGSRVPLTHSSWQYLNTTECQAQ